MHCQVRLEKPLRNPSFLRRRAPVIELLPDSRSRGRDSPARPRGFLEVLLPVTILVVVAALLGGCGSTPETAAPSWSTAPAGSDDPRRAQLLTVAREQIGVPYRYGGTDPRGFDCSGLVHYTHDSLGLAVPRTADSQRRAARPVPVGELRPGDLLFFDVGAGKGWHVGIYEGGGQFIHAPSGGKRVSRARLDNPYWRERLVAAGTYL